MKILLDNARAKVIESTEAERKWLYSYLQFTDGKRFWAARMAKINADTKAKLYDKRNNTFPAGLVPMVARAAQKEHATAIEDGSDPNDADIIHPAIIVDGREPPCTWDFDAAAAGELEWLRDYQFEAVWHAAQATRGIIKMATGAGKAEMMWGFRIALPCHWLVLIHRKQLLVELKERYEQHTGERAGLCGAGKWAPDPNRLMTFAGFQTLSRRLNKKDKEALHLIGDVEGLLVDECHVLPAKSFRKVGLACRNAYYRMGLSGTPLDRSDNRSTFAVAVLGEMIVDIPAPALIEQGWLAKPKIVMIPLWQVRYGGETGGGWQASYDELIEKSDARNALVLDIVEIAAKPCLVFVKGVEHGRYLVDIFKRCGVPSEFISGETPVPSRRAAVKRLEHGDIDVLVATSPVMQEGINIPTLASAVNGAAMASTIAALQRVGRGTRKTETKDEFEFWDIFDQGDRYMERHAKKRKKAYEKEGYEVKVEVEAAKWREGVRASEQLDFGYLGGMHKLDKTARRDRRRKLLNGGDEEHPAGFEYEG